jgi:exodeoxyribonuclease VII small subunit
MGWRIRTGVQIGAGYQGKIYEISQRVQILTCSTSNSLISKDDKMAKGKNKQPEEMAYEEAFQELKDLVEKLEAQDLQLEEGLELFERGQALAKRCGQLLEEAEIKITQITTSDSGEVVETDLELPEE